MANPGKAQTTRSNATATLKPTPQVSTPAFADAQLSLQRAVAAPMQLQPADVVHLQRTIGNQATGQLLQARLHHTVAAQPTPAPRAALPPVTALSSVQRALAAPAPVPTANLRSSLPGSSPARNRFLQAKLTLGPAGDKYEQEADRTAKQVMNSLSAAAPAVQRHEQGGDLMQAKPLANGISRIQRQDMEEEDELQAKPLADGISRVQRQDVDEDDELQAKPLSEGISRVQRQDIEEEDELQAKALHGLEGGEVQSDVADSIEGAKGGGQPLDNGVRASMEQGFGADFSGVRVHTGGQADALNRSLNARAFTTGSDIFFGNGQYNPGSSAGQELIAHELTHTVQQGAAGANAQRKVAGDLIQRRIGYELETGIPVMYEAEEDTRFDRFDNDELEAPFPGGKLMVDHLPNHEPTASEPFDEWNIIEFVTNPVADDLPDDQIRPIFEGWIQNLVDLRDYAKDNFDYINYAPHVGNPKHARTVISLPKQKARTAYNRWNRIGPQATMGIKLSKVGQALGNTTPGQSWQGTTKYNRVVEGAHRAEPTAQNIVTKLQQLYPATNNNLQGVDALTGYLTLVLNYLLSGAATGTSGYIKNRSVFMYKSKLSSVRNGIVGDYYAGKILSRYPKRRRKLRDMLLKKAGLRSNDEVYKGAEFPVGTKVRAGTWVDEVLAGTEDRLFESMKNPWSNEIAPEAIHGEQGAVMEMRDFKENQIDNDNMSLQNPDNVVDVMMAVYRLNRQWATT